MKTKSVQRTVCSRPLKAFTLVEVVIAMLIVGIVIVALYTALAFGVRMVQLSRENLRATEILTQKMETLRVYSWDQVTDPKEIPRDFVAYFDSEENPKKPKNPKNPKSNGAGLVYTGRITFAPAWTDVSYGKDLTNITVTLSWNSSSTRLARTRQFTTLVARNGLQSYIY